MNEEFNRPRWPMDPESLRRLHETALRVAANGRNPVLAEMAREVLAGRTTLRAAVTSAGYREAFAEAGDQAMRALRGKSMDDLRREAAESPDDQDDRPDAGDGTPDDGDEYFDRPIMRGAEPARDEPRAGQDETPRRARWNRRRS